MALLYAGLEAGQSGAVIAAIERTGVQYDVRGDSIWVPRSNRDQLRMILAGEGLPSVGSAGYELLDGMSGFGTTSQMFDAAFWRAKEGELARTILALPNIKVARVHLAVPAGRGYRREASAAASVTLTTNGNPVSPAQSRALRYLVSSGVPGMSADHVTVIDSERGVIPSADDLTSDGRATEMKRNVERILEPHVGMGNAIVELNLELVTEAELFTEQRFDPQEKVLISQESEESSDQSNRSDAGAVTAASNLPEGQDENGPTSRSARSEARQRSNFEVSSVTREVRKQPGDVRRLSVAVLVNGSMQPDGNGQMIVMPRPDAELEALKQLVASAVGLSEGRGDQLTLKSFPFVSMGEPGTTMGARSLLERLEINSMIRIALIGAFAIVLTLLLLRPALQGRLLSALDRSSPPALPSDPAIGNLALQEPATIAAEPEIDFVPIPNSPPDPVARLRDLMKERQEESLKVLSGWIEKREDAL